MSVDGLGNSNRSLHALPKSIKFYSLSSKNHKIISLDYHDSVSMKLSSQLIKIIRLDHHGPVRQPELRHDASDLEVPQEMRQGTACVFLRILQFFKI
jgi:hypothetical protein